ncbi:MAG: cytochrome C [Geopsychrobacter sp.]|nr:cytochrome C [Geopsychrobacter sp.]
MHYLIIVFTLSLVSLSSGSFALPLTANANKHNLSSNSLNAVRAASDTRICVFCHTPHGASPQSALWNRKDPSTASFPLYSSGTLNIDDPAIVSASQYTNADPKTYPNGATRMCLSCHDGVSAVGEVLSSSSTISMLTNTLSGNAVVSLATSHPVSFVYDTTVLNYINTTLTVADYKLPTAVPLDGLNRMQCTTCHDPHEDTRTLSYTLPFWRNYSGGTDDIADYDGTCLDCHQGSQWGGSWGGTPATIH